MYTEGQIALIVVVVVVVVVVCVRESVINLIYVLLVSSRYDFFICLRFIIPLLLLWSSSVFVGVRFNKCNKLNLCY